jgi:hypothetical protein
MVTKIKKARHVRRWRRTLSAGDRRRRGEGREAIGFVATSFAAKRERWAWVPVAHRVPGKQLARHHRRHLWHGPAAWCLPRRLVLGSDAAPVRRRRDEPSLDRGAFGSRHHRKDDPPSAPLDGRSVLFSLRWAPSSSSGPSGSQSFKLAGRPIFLDLAHFGGDGRQEAGPLLKEELLCLGRVRPFHSDPGRSIARSLIFFETSLTVRAGAPIFPCNWKYRSYRR